MKALRREPGHRQAPQLDGARQALATLLLTVLLDQLLDALDLSRRIRRGTKHPVSVCADELAALCAIAHRRTVATAILL